MATGDITYTHKAGASAESAFASGKIEVDASEAVNVICGFQPSMIEFYYKDTGAVTNDVHIKWFAGMTAANYFNSVLDGTNVTTMVTSAGPVVYTDTDGEGFTIPAALQTTDDDVIYWIAWR